MATILLVDDSETDRRLVAELLKPRSDWEVECCANGREALARMNRSLPDLVVTDLYMPKMDGLQLVESIRREHPRLPVVLITSKGNEETAVKALQLGAASYVPKHLLKRYLIPTINSLLAAIGQRRSRAKLFGSMQASEYVFCLENDGSLISSLVGYFQETMSHMGICDETDRLRTSVALEEALVNAIHHGNLEVDSTLRERGDSSYTDAIKQRLTETPYSDRRVHLKAKMTGSRAEFVIRDEGPGFDTTKLPDPTDAANLEKAGGRGVMLMKTFMDEVNYNEVGNEVTLVKLAGVVNMMNGSSKLLDVECVSGVLIVTPRGDVTSLTDDNLDDDLRGIVEQFQHRDLHGVVVDFAHVVRFGSSILEVLRRVWNVVKEREGTMALCNVSDFGREVLKISRFDTVWPICDSWDEALKLVGR